MEHELLAPLEWSTVHPPLLVPEWNNLGVTRFPIPNAGRHFLIIGETGSGKTRSAIMPLAVAAFRYPDATAYSAYHDAATARGVPAEARHDLRPAMLVIDPKHEIRAVLEALGRAISDPRPIVSLSLNPYEPPDDSAFLSVERLVEQGACVVYSPEELTTLADVVGRSLKTRFFEQVFQRKNRVRPFFYICDEFQRYITGDKISGEQSFLDRCRAYRVVCALATQSLSSLRYSLSVSDLAGGGAMTADAALEVVRTNTGNAFYFRNSDRETQRMLRELLPAPDIAGKPHVTEVRPISSLRVGECYYLLSDGRLGRGQVTLAESERF